MFGSFITVGGYGRSVVIISRIITIESRRLFGNGEDFISKTRNAIIKNTEITRDHLTPELRLHLLTENCSLYHEPAPPQFYPSKSENIEPEKNFYDDETEADTIARTFREPFWSIYWPGGQALTRFVLDHGEELFSKRYTNVLDIGTGSGATAIAAKLRGANDVVANDIEPVACVAVDMNAALNNVRLTEISRENLIDKNYEASTYKKPFDFIFVGDLLYDQDISDVLETWLEQAVHRGARVFLGDPGRHGLNNKLKRKLKIVKRYDLPDNVKRENYGFGTATVYEFLKSKPN